MNEKSRFNGCVRRWWSALAIVTTLLAGGGLKAHAFIHPGIPLTTNDLDDVKNNLGNAPWSEGYAALLADGRSSTNYVMQGPFGYANRNLGGNFDHLGAWEGDMQAIFNLSRMWYFTKDNNYAQKSHDILIAWANTMTNFGGVEAALDLGDYSVYYGSGADILRGTWPGWTAADTLAVSNLFANVYLPVTYLGSTNTTVAGPANKGTLSIVGALVCAVFNDDTNLFNHLLYIYRSSAACGVHNNCLTSGEMGETGRDQGHAYGGLLQLARIAEIFYKQGVDIYSEDDNRVLACGEYYARNNLSPPANFIPFGTVDWYYTANSSTGGGYTSNPEQANIVRSAYVVRKHLTAPWMVLKRNATPPNYGVIGAQTENENSFSFLKSADTSTAVLPPPLPYPTAATLTSGLTDVDIGGATPTGSSSYLNGVWTVTGGGADIFTHNPDSCHFAYKALTGDCTMIAKVNSVQATAGNSRAGVMIRDSLSSSTAYRAFVTITPSKTVDSFTHGWSSCWGGAAYESGIRPITQSSYWVKVERFGKMINLYASPDGTSWGAVSSAQYDNLPSTMYVGLVVCSENNGSSCTATFSNVSITGGNGGNITVPAAPYYVYASPDAGQVPLRWLTSFGASSYSVYRSLTNGGPYTLRASGLTNASYIDTNVAANTTYYYVVTATNSVGVSGYSTEESVTTQPAPAPPAGLTALPGNGQATLLWAANSVATSYNVKRSTTSGSGYVTITNVTGTSWLNTGLANGTTYYYVVSSIGAAGEGTNSSQVSVTPGASAATLFWSGAVNGNWDTSTANWLNNGSSAAYQNGNAVIFDDTVLSNTTVSLSATLSPGTVIFNSSLKSYSINGSAIGGACGITLFGSAPVALNGTQTFTGGVSVQQGATLMAASSGAGSGMVTLNGGALKTVVGSGLNSTVTNTINVGSGGATFALSSSAGNLTLTGPISGSGNVTIAPPGGILNSINLNFSTNSVSGTITIPNSSGGNQTVTRIGTATAGNRNAAWSIGGAQDRFTTLDFGTGTIEFGSLSGSGTIWGNSSGVHTLSVGALNQDSTFDGNIGDGTGTVALTKVGSGTQTLTGANTYTGTNNVNAGKLLILTGSQAKGNYTVANGATLSVTNATTGSASVSNLTLSAGSAIEFIDPASTTTPLLSASNVTVSGSCTVNISLPDGIALGTYPLANYSGSFSGNFANLQLQLPAGISGTLVSNANQIALSITLIPIPAALTSLVAIPHGMQIELDWNAAATNYATGYNIWRSLTSGSGYTLVGNTTNTTFVNSGLAVNTTYYYVVTATNSFGSSAYSPEASATTQPAMKWTGAKSVNWDLGSTNWSFNGLPTVYQDGSSVWFDDTALSNVTINVSATMSPSIVVVSNSSKSYSFSGNDISGTGSLLKLGNGTVTLNVANTYSGGTTMSNGTLIVSDSAALGSGPLSLNGGTFGFAGAIGYMIANDVSVGGSVNIKTASGVNWVLGGNWSGSGSLTLLDPGVVGQWQFGGDNSGYTGTFTENSGNTSLAFNSASAGSASAAWVFNNPTAQRTRLNFGAGTINFGSISGNGSIANVAGSGLATMSVGALNTSTTFSGIIGDSSGQAANISLVKVGTGSLTLSGVNKHTGTNNILSGKLIISTASLAKGVYLVASNATFGVTNTTTTSATISNLIVTTGSALEFQRVTNPVTPLIAASNLIVNGSCLVKIIGTNGLKIGTNYPLVSYSGTFSGQLTNLLLQMPAGYSGTLVPKTNLLTLTVSSTNTPSGLTATPGYNQIILNWTAFIGATNYNVKRAMTSGGPYTTIATSTTTGYTDLMVTNGATYYYVVSALTANGESPNSVEASAAPLSPLHAYLKFDESSGTNAADSTGNGWNGTLFNGSTWVAGYSNNAVSLSSGSSQYVALPAGVVSTLPNITVAAWVKLATVADWNRIFDFGTGTGTYMFLTPQYGGNGKVRFAITTSGSGGEQQINSSSTLSLNAWHHVAVTINGSVGVMYVDGAAVGTNSSMTLNPTSLGNTTQNYIGKSQFNDPYLNGQVDEFRIYSTALSRGEIATFVTPLAAPTGLTATAGDSQVTLNWNAVASATNYQVFRSLTNGGPYSQIATVTATNYLDIPLLNGTNYFYVVKAANAVGTSANSTQVSARPVSTVPPQLAMSINSSQLQLNWPADHLGWRLQSQTNPLASGLGTNWMTVPNSTNQLQYVAPINSTNGSVFFRLVYP